MTKDELNDVYYYDESSKSCLRRNKNLTAANKRVQIFKDSEVGSLTSNGYYSTRYMGKSARVHRLIWIMFNGPIEDGMFIDHINQNKSDNRISNLRVVTRTTNNRNKAFNAKTVASTGHVGVTMSNFYGRQYVLASVSADGTHYQKRFNIKKLGLDNAICLAIDERKKIIERLNNTGHDFSVNHGAIKSCEALKESA